MQKISTCLWFDSQAEKAVQFYTTVFKNSKIIGTTHYTEFTEAVSMVINCESQSEIDEYWEKLSAGGQIIECGWLRDRFGLSWQVVPTLLNKLLMDKDPRKVDRVLAAMLGMKKLDIARLKSAYEQ